MASGREVLISDLPPELLNQQGNAQTSGNWEQGLRYWADQQLTHGVKTCWISPCRRSSAL